MAAVLAMFGIRLKLWDQWELTDNERELWESV
jgi:hypothetical protein